MISIIRHTGLLLLGLLMLVGVACGDSQAQQFFDTGLEYALAGEHQKAIGFFEEVIRLDPQNRRVWYERGIAYFNLGEYQKSIQDLSEFLRLDPEDALAYYYRGSAYFNLRQYEKAIEDYTEVIFSRLDTQALAYYNRGSAYQELGRPAKGRSSADRKKYRDRAEADYKRACELDSKYCN